MRTEQNLSYKNSALIATLKHLYTTDHVIQKSIFKTSHRILHYSLEVVKSHHFIKFFNYFNSPINHSSVSSCKQNQKQTTNVGRAVGFIST